MHDAKHSRYALLKLVAAMIFVGLTASCYPSPEPKSDTLPLGRWQMVAVPPGSKIPGTEFGMSPPAIWRLDTQTGNLEFCYQDGGIKCGPPYSSRL